MNEAATQEPELEGAPPITLRSPGVLLGAFREMLGRRAGIWLAFGALASIVLATVEVGVAVVLQLLLRNLGLLSKEVDTLPILRGFSLGSTGLGVALLTIGLTRALCQFVASQSANVAQEAITARLRRFAIYEMLLHPSRRFVPAAQVNAQVGDLALKSSSFAYLAVAVMTAAIQAGSLLLIMLLAARYEALIALGGLFVIGLLITYLSRKSRKVVEKVPEQLALLIEGIERVARNSLLVRTLRTQPLEHARLATAVDSYEKHSVHAAFIGSLSVAVTPFLGVVLILIILAASQNVLHTKPLVLVSFLYLFLRFVQQLAAAVSYLATCNQLWPQTRMSLAFVARLGRDHTSRAAVELGRAEGRSNTPRPAERGAPPSVDVKGLSFRYPGQKNLVLDRVDVDVAPGTQLGIVGPSGRGKSTLLSLLLGLLTPSAGAVTLGGRSPTAFFDDPSVRVGYVGAEAFLVAGTVRDNLKYGVPFHTTDDDLWRALAGAHLDGVVRGLAGGLDYPIEEDGSGLSAGQKQRLCLARALLGDPHLLVLDEASANLDEGTEADIALSIRDLAGKTTVVVVSHRKGLLAYADRVIELGAAKADRPEEA